MEIGRGIIITIGGMGLVFLSLAVILLVIMALNWWFSSKEANSGSLSLVEAGETQDDHDLETDEELVAAISVAVAILAEEVGLKRESKTRVAARKNGASLWRAVVWPQFFDVGGLRRRR